MVTKHISKLVSNFPLTTIIAIVLATIIALSFIVFKGIDSDYSEEAFMTETDESEAMKIVQSDYSRGTSSISILVKSTDDNLLTPEALVEMLEMQQALANDSVIIPTLANPEEPESSFSSIAVMLADIVMISGDRESGANTTSGFDATNSTAKPTGPPEPMPVLNGSLSAKIAALESITKAQLKGILQQIFTTDQIPPEVTGGMSMMLTEDFDPAGGRFEAKGTILLVNLNRTGIRAGHQSAEDEFTESERRMDEIVRDSDLSTTEMTVMSETIMSDQIMEASMTSVMILIPLAFILVLVILALIYRNFFDMVFSIVALVFAIIWVYGFGSAFGFTFNPMTVVIPVLIAGLGIDYGIHITMRFREETAMGTDIRNAIRRTVTHVGMALFLTTITTVIAFVSNMASPIALLGEFGILSALGIVSSFIIMVTFVPAIQQIKTLRRARIEAVSNSTTAKPRKKSNLTLFDRLLSTGATAAEHHPVIVILVVVIITSGALFGALNVSTAFDFNDFLPEDLEITKDINFMMEEFHMLNVEGESVFVVIEADVTDPDLLLAVDTSIKNMADDETVIVHGSRPSVQSILSFMADWATNQTLTGVPDRYFSPEFKILYNSVMTDAGVPAPDATRGDIKALYAWLYGDTNASASIATMLHMTPGGDYDGTIIEISVNVDPTSDDNIDKMIGELAEDITPLEGLTDDSVITGNTVIMKNMRDTMYASLLWSLSITFIACFLILTIIFWLRLRSFALGAITMIPIALCVIWIMGTMYVLDISLNVMTLMVTSLTIGLGIDYGIHITSRFLEDMKRFDRIDEAIRSTVGHTGMALFGTTITTVTGFGILVFAPMPPLQQFGGITALTILFSFLSSVFVLPTFLVIWTRFGKRR